MNVPKDENKWVDMHRDDTKGGRLLVANVISGKGCVALGGVRLKLTV